MDIELEKRIHEAAPTVFQSTARFHTGAELSPNNQRRMFQPLSLCIGNGWYDLMMDLVNKVESHIVENNVEFMLTDIKSKFGGLRFYYVGGDDIIDAMVEEAEARSIVTCEICGAPGESRWDGWVETLCDHHFKEV